MNSQLSKKPFPAATMSKMRTSSKISKMLLIATKQQIKLSSPIVLLIALSAIQILLIAVPLIQSAKIHSLVNNRNEPIDFGSDHSSSDQHHQQGSNKHQMNGKLTSANQHQAAASTSLVSTTNGNQNRCQSGWMWFNNKCWVTTQSRRDFAHAMELCKKMFNSTLPTIHSDDENEFLRQNIDLNNSPIWLYARHNHQYNKTRWLDKSPVNYTRWDSGQPSDKSSLVCIKTEDGWFMKKSEAVDGQTECVSFWGDARWGTQVGCLVLLPVVCEKKLTPIIRYSDGPNTTSSNYEQQQMYPVSGANDRHYANQQQQLLIITAIVTAIVANWMHNSIMINTLKHKQSFGFISSSLYT